MSPTILTPSLSLFWIFVSSRPRFTYLYRSSQCADFGSKEASSFLSALVRSSGKKKTEDTLPQSDTAVDKSVLKQRHRSGVLQSLGLCNLRSKCPPSFPESSIPVVLLCEHVLQSDVSEGVFVCDVTNKEHALATDVTMIEKR